MEVLGAAHTEVMDIDHHLPTEDTVWDIVRIEEDVWAVCLDV